jgi:predicted regulator of Ras-like GTPase activity (Roadblock/LC7/MglB family)
MDEVINQIVQIKEIKGALQTNNEGEDIASTIEDEQLSHFIRFLVGYAPLFEQTSELGPVSSIILTSNKDDNLGVFIGKEQSLGVVFARGCAIKKLNSKIDDYLKKMSIGDT